MNSRPEKRTSPQLRNFSRIALLSLALIICNVLILVGSSHAQIAITLEGQAIYDDNIYLESDKGLPLDYKPPVVIDENGVETTLPTPVDGDGKPNDDIMYYAGLSLSSDLPISSYLKSGAHIKGGYIFFTDQSEANRFLIDSYVSVASESKLIPSPYGISLSSSVNSSSYKIAVPQGTTGRNAVSHDGDLNFNLGEHKLAEKTSLVLGYGLKRHDYIGDLTTGGGSEDLAVKQEGADWFSNRADLSLKRDITDFFNSSLGFYADAKNFTSSNIVGIDGTKAKDLDRIDYGSSLNGNYTISDKSSCGAGVGVDIGHYLDNPPAKFVVEPANPNLVEQTENNDQVSLSFSGNFNYQIFVDSSVSLGAGQHVATDIEGGRAIGRDFSANFLQLFGERVQFVLGGKFSQYSSDASLADSTDRFEGSAAFNITITPTVALSLGYSYANQNAGTGLEVQTLNNDYEDNKFFVGLSTGLVGIKD